MTGNEYHRCHKLHATITLAHCEAMRARPMNGNMMARARPPQCNGCEDWKSWNNDVSKQEDHKMPTKAPQKCEGCGKVKTLLSKTLCHKCHRAQNEAAAKAAPYAKSIAARLFKENESLLRQLHDVAKRDFRTVDQQLLYMITRDLKGDM